MIMKTQRKRRGKRKRRRVDPARIDNWRICDTIAALFALAGWGVATLDYELRYAELRSGENCKELNIGNTLHWINLILTLCALVFMFLRHLSKYRWNVEKNNKKAPWSSLTRFTLEALVLCIFPYPYVYGEIYVDQRHLRPDSHIFERIDVCYTVSEVLYALMFLRFFFVLRAFLNMSQFIDLHAKQVCREYDVKANMRFTLRALAQYRPLLLLVVIVLPPALMAAQLIRLFERPYVLVSGKDFTAFTNAVYFTFVAMSTIAYGDFYPCTQMGRFCAVLCEIWGMAMFSMMIYLIDVTFRASKQQETAYREIHRSRLAGRLIAAWYLHSLRRREDTEQLLALHHTQYRAGKRRLLTVRTLKDDGPKEMLVRLEEAEATFTRLEIKTGAMDLLEAQLQHVIELLASFDH